MSVKVMGKIFDVQGLSPRDKFVLIAYADHADHEGYNIRPSIDTIARKTGYTRRTVQRATRSLNKMGILVFMWYSKKGTNTWKVDLEKLDEIGVTESQGGVSGTPPQRQPDAPGGVSGTPEPSFNRPLIKQTDLFQVDPKLYFDTLQQGKGAPETRDQLTSDDYKERVRAALVEGMANNAGVDLDLASWPEDVKPIILKLYELWKIKPPTRVKDNKKKGTPCGLWITSARDLIDACGEFGVDILASYYDKWTASKRVGAAHDVNSPRSLVNVVRGHAAKLREEAESGGRPGWAGATSVEYSEGAQKWQDT